MQFLKVKIITPSTLRHIYTESLQDPLNFTIIDLSLIRLQILKRKKSLEYFLIHEIKKSHCTVTCGIGVR